MSNVYKIIKVERQGKTSADFFCYYEYKPECEPEVNKKKWPNPKDRWYEDYIWEGTIREAIADGIPVEDKDGLLDHKPCAHDWLFVGEPYGYICNNCGEQKPQV